MARIPHHLKRVAAARALFIAGASCLVLAAFLHVAARSIFDAEIFGQRTAASLSDPGVASFVSDAIATAVVRSQPDLITVRPLILAASGSLLATYPFQSLAGAAARRAHQAVFSQGAERLLVSLPDAHVLLREALQQASPQLAAKLPRQMQTAVSILDDTRWARALIRVGNLRRHIGTLWQLLLPAGIFLLSLGVWIAPNRRRAVVRCGLGLLMAGLFLAALLPAGSLLASASLDPLPAGLARGLWLAYFGDLWNWALLLGGLGVILAAGAASLLESVDPLHHVKRLSRFLVAPPSKPRLRALWGATLFLAGLAAIVAPSTVLNASLALLGAGAAYIGVRELFRLFLERVAPFQEETHQEGQPPTRGWLLAAAAVFSLVAILAAAWVFWRNPLARPALASTLACNGHPELCSRTLDQVAFAGAHNAMSNQGIPDWMFPHQEKSIPGQLRDGVRALLIDVHYGFPGGSRVKTDMDAEPMAAKVKEAVGEQGYQAALRIRNNMVGVDEGNHRLYLCHGVCELGAYELTPTLRDIRDFLLAHPDEVILIIIEDYVQPAELAEAFRHSGLDAMVYRGTPAPRWPTLGELVKSGQRAVIFLESGRPGVDWLRPAFSSMMETPYSFHKPEEFSCRPNRGPASAPLFLLNNWVETTPTPKPSNAAKVNAFEPLLARARACAAERRHIPNIVAVDFYATGDLLRVVDALNGFSPR